MRNQKVRELSVSNTGTATLTVTKVEVVGTNASALQAIGDLFQRKSLERLQTIRHFQTDGPGFIPGNPPDLFQ